MGLGVGFGTTGFGLGGWGLGVGFWTKGFGLGLGGVGFTAGNGGGVEEANSKT